MLELVIILLVIFFIIGLIGCLIEWIKNHLELILGIAAIVVILLVGWAVLPFVLNLGLLILPAVLVVAPALALIVWLRSRAMKLRARKYLKWLKKVGVGAQDDAPGRERVWNWAKSKKYAVELEGGLVLSGELLKTVTKAADQCKIVTEPLIRDCCLKAAPDFQAENTAALLDYMQRSGRILSLRAYGREPVYLAPAFKSQCEHSFELEGAATADEFAAMCERAAGDAAVSVDPAAIAEAVLAHMEEQGNARRVALSDLGEDLYVSNKLRSDSKLTRREISID